jgi:hypothetical protein
MQVILYLFNSMQDCLVKKREVRKNIDALLSNVAPNSQD